MVRVILTTKPPRSLGDGSVDHTSLAPMLQAVAADGLKGLPDLEGDLERYLTAMADIEPDGLSRSEAVAFWINLYNVGVLRVAAAAQKTGRVSVLRVPGAFDRPTINVDGQYLSLDSIEHGKVRRFQDPRIHAALVCGSVSCPSLRPEPYNGITLDRQLDDQMQKFLSGGAAARTEDGRLLLSRVFAWYGADFVRPHRMPALVPAKRSAVRDALTPWLPPELADWVRHADPDVTFMRYDWSLRCAVG